MFADLHNTKRETRGRIKINGDNVQEPNASSSIIVEVLRDEEIGGQVFILFTREVGLRLRERKLMCGLKSGFY